MGVLLRRPHRDPAGVADPSALHGPSPEILIRGRFALAVRLVLARPRWWVLGLAGFLARGGIVLLALPMLAIPSVVGIATFLGPDAVTSAGLSARFVVIVATASGLGIVALVAGSVVGAAVDVVLIEEAGVEVDAAAGTNLAIGDRSAGRLSDIVRRVAKVVAIRALALVPVAIAVALAMPMLVTAAYHELILPGDLAQPLVLRVVGNLPWIGMTLALVWLAAEAFAAIAVREAVLADRTTAGSVTGALHDVARRPLAAIWVTLGTLAGSIVVLLAVLLLTTLAWERVQHALLSSDAFVGLAAVGFLLVAWMAGLVLAGIAAAWRSVAWTLTFGRDLRGTVRQPIDSGTLGMDGRQGIGSNSGA